MARRALRVAGALACFLFLVVLVTRQEGRSDLNAANDPIVQWVFDPAARPEAGGRINSRVGALPLRLTGTPTLSTDGPTPALVFSGESDGAFADAAAAAKAKLLPTKEIGLAAWVRVDRSEPPGSTGGLVGLFQNHFDAELGFLLGFEGDHFSFGLSAESTVGLGSPMTVVRDPVKFVPGKWYHVAAGYDGKRMSLWVNGRLAGESTEQVGPIRYPGGRVPLTMGRYHNGQDPQKGYNNNEDDVPFLGAIREVAIYARPLSPEAVSAAFEAHKDLTTAPPAVAAPHFVVPPYLQYPTTDSIRIMWETSEPGPSIVEYGLGRRLDKKVEDATPKTLHEVTLTGLAAETRYLYRVSTPLANGRTLAAEPLTFETAVKPTSAFTFAVLGDTQKNPRMTGAIARQIWSRRPNFVIHCGDVVNNGPDKAEWVDELFRPCRSLVGRVAVFPCIGNHEQNHPNYYRYFSLPAPEYYYSYRYGNAEFFVLDSNKSLKPGSEQYEWLDRTLGRSTATWKIAYHHHPVRSSDDNDFGNTWRGESSKYGDVNAQNLIALYEKHGLDLNFNGHIHVYERSWPVRGGKVDHDHGVVYVTSGGGGATLENFAPTPAWFKAQCRVDYHYCVLTVHGKRLEFKAFDHKGRLFDSFELSK
ncbi:MAG TPA: LamG-like jellyroll fold domain-containing protein [Fimbriiglobus sp.]